MVIVPQPDFAPGIPRPAKMTFWSGPVPENTGIIYRTFDWTPAPMTKATWGHALALAEMSYSAFFQGLNIVSAPWSLAPKGSVDPTDPEVRKTFMSPLSISVKSNRKKEQVAEMAA
jgi:hypothetical protein